MSRIDDIRARLEAATDGPWEQLSGKYMAIDRGLSPQQFNATTVDDEELMRNAPTDIAYLLDVLGMASAALSDIANNQKSRDNDLIAS